MILILVLFILFVLSLSGKKSKLLAFLIMMLAWLLIAFNYNNADYNNYVIRYDVVASWVGVAAQGVSDMGFSLIMRWFYVIGVQDYYYFKFIVSSLSLLFFLFFIVKTVRYPAIWALLYLFFYVTLDITQFRNFVGFSIILALFPLLERDTFTSNIIFLIGVLFATTIHFSMAFFLITGLKLIKRKNIRLLLIVGSLLLLFLFREQFMVSVSDSMYYNKIDAYERTSVMGALVTTALFVVNYMLIHYYYLKCKKDVLQNGQGTKVIMKEMTLVNNIATYLLILIPFVFINSIPVRILRFVSLVEIAYLLNYASLLGIKRQKNIISLCFAIAIFFFVWAATDALDGLKYNYIRDYFL